MEKILLVINAHKPDSESIKFASYIASLVQSKLTGLFVENVYWDYVSNEADQLFSSKKKKNEAATVTTDTEQAIEIFEKQCRTRKVEPEVYIDRGEPVQEIIFESRFADLLIIDPGLSFYGKVDQLPSHLVKEVLIHTECPVLLTPERFKGLEEIVFCYDGSASSVFSIKQFTLMFPQLSNKNTVLLEVNRTGNEEFSEGHRRMMEWLKAHYQSAYYHALAGKAKDELYAYFFMTSKKLIVMGAYGRSMLANLFNRSNADVVMRMADLPLFITHR
ncbi:MAG TPA: universal stress protein [Flavisolibacter sp.]|nr:universal stress protein [Flavisolibacter sp.]